MKLARNFAGNTALAKCEAVAASDFLTGNRFCQTDFTRSVPLRQQRRLPIGAGRAVSVAGIGNVFAASPTPLANKSLAELDQVDHMNYRIIATLSLLN